MKHTSEAENLRVKRSNHVVCSQLNDCMGTDLFKLKTFVRNFKLRTFCKYFGESTGILAKI